MSGKIYRRPHSRTKIPVPLQCLFPGRLKRSTSRLVSGLPNNEIMLSGWKTEQYKIHHVLAINAGYGALILRHPWNYRSARLNSPRSNHLWAVAKKSLPRMPCWKISNSTRSGIRCCGGEIWLCVRGGCRILHGCLAANGGVSCIERPNARCKQFP
jgi:hypothetical protein